MDKYEYKVRSEQIRALIAEKDYAQAAEIADTIDWRRVRSVAMLCMISDLYKINRRYEDARDLLLLAYERHPGGRSICYSLCELSIKMEEFVQALEYYKEFVQAAPKDAARYILQYKLYEAQDVSLEERIAVLEEYKKREYREKWAYELAYLYHRVGLSTKCVEECDELILWFGEGKYVIKAMELKMLHEPLTPQQQGAYNNRFQPKTVYVEEEEPEEEQTEETSSLEEALPEGGYYPEAEGAPEEGYYPGPEGTPEEGYYPEAGEAPEEGYYPGPEGTPEEGYYPEAGEAPEEGYYPGPEGTPEEGYYPEAGEAPEEGYYPGPEGTPEEGYYPEAEGAPEEGYYPETGEASEEGYYPGPEGEPEEGYYPEQGSVEYSTGKMHESEPEYYPEEGGEGLEGENSYVAEELSPEEAGILSRQDTIPAAPRRLEENVPSDEDILKAPTQVYGEDFVQKVEAALTPEKSAESQAPENVEEEEPEIQVKTVDVSPYNTINLQKEIAEGLKEVLGEEEPLREEEYSSEELYAEEEAYQPEETYAEETEFQPEEIYAEEEPQSEEFYAEEEVPQPEEVYVEEGPRPEEVYAEEGPRPEEVYAEEKPQSEEVYAEEEELQPEKGETASDLVTLKFPVSEPESQEETPLQEELSSQEKQPPREASSREELPLQEEMPIQEELPEELAEVLSQESDGQISLVLEEQEKIEKQITGQLTIADVLREWEKNQNKDYQEKTDVEPDEDAEEFEASSEPAEAPKIEPEEEPKAKTIEEPKAEPKAEAAEAPTAEPEEEPETEAPKAELKAEAAEAPKAEPEEEPKTEEPKAEPVEAPKAETKAGPKAEPKAEPGKKSKPSVAPVERDKAHVRDLTKEERELFAPYLQNSSDYEKLVKALDSVSLAAFTGNVIVTGDEGLDTFTLAKNIVIDVQLSDTNFSGKTAKISGAALNGEDVSKIMEQLTNGALIVQKASGMDRKTADEMYKNLQKESTGIIVLLEDTKRAMNKFLAQNEKLAECFNARMDLEALSNEALVAYGKKYARDREYSIDEFGVLALHTRIEDMQSSDHAVTIMEVRDIVDEAIKSANRKTVKHFCDILLAKRYDEEDMIILREKDFLS